MNQGRTKSAHANAEQTSPTSQDVCITAAEQGWNNDQKIHCTRTMGTLLAGSMATGNQF